MSNIGYRRVSSVQQSLDRQLNGLELDRVFDDKISGKNFDRPAFNEMMNYVREGDVVHVHSLDRLGRNLTDMLNVVAELRAKGVALVALKENIDTRNDSPMANIQIQLFGMFAELERNMMLERQREAMEAAKANGVWRPRGKAKGIDHKAIREALAGGLSVRKAAAEFGVAQSTISRIKVEMREAEALTDTTK